MIKVRRLNNRKIRLPINIKLFRDSKMVFRSTFFKRSAVVVRIQVISWNRAYMKVNYSCGYFNSGYYNNLQDLKESLSVFTEKALLDFIEGKVL